MHGMKCGGCSGVDFQPDAKVQVRRSSDDP